MINARRRAVVTGLGVVAANGIGAQAFWDANRRGISGVRAVTSFDAAPYESRIAAEVRDFDPRDFLPEKIVKRVDRYVHFALAAAGLAAADAGLRTEQEEASRVGVILGTGLGGILFHEAQLLEALRTGNRRFNPLAVSIVSPNAVSAHVAMQFRCTGPNFVVSTACASGNHALGESLRKVQTGEGDVMFTGGVEAPLTEFVFGAFQAMKVLSKNNAEPSRASRPYDRARDGFVMGEGGAVLVLEELEHALRRNARIYAEVTGYGSNNGAYHMVMPDPTGDDAAAAMRAALRDAGLAPENIHYINAHGTGTPANDVCETRAIRQVFGPHCRRLPVSSTKSMIGHALGAAPALEAAVCCLALSHQEIPPTINYEHPDPECDLDYVPNVSRRLKLDAVLSNAFGFGNANASIVLARYPQ